MSKLSSFRDDLCLFPISAEDLIREATRVMLGVKIGSRKDVLLTGNVRYLVAGWIYLVPGIGLVLSIIFSCWPFQL